MKDYQHLNVSFLKALSVPLWDISNGEFKRKSISLPAWVIREISRFIYYSICTKPKVVKKEASKSKLFFLRAYSRSDLNEHAGIFEAAIPASSVCVLSQRDTTFDLLAISKCFCFMWIKRKEFQKILRKKFIPLFSQEGFFIFMTLVNALSDFFKIYPYLKRAPKVVSFQEMVPVENLVCQVANMLGIPTYALQHALGAYTDSGSYEARYSRVHYDASVCKTILVWGESTKKYFRKCTDANIYLIGKPVLPSLSIFSEGVTFIFEADDDVNNKLLSLSDDIESRGYEVSRWYRPGHKLVKDGVVREGPLRKMIIGWRSSLLVELGSIGGCVFVISESVFRDDLPLDLVVQNVNQIEDRYKMICDYPYGVWKHFIDCTGQETVNRYKSILETNR